MKQCFVLLCLFCFALSFAFYGWISFAAPQDWLKKAYTKSHNPGDGEPYSVSAEARDMFDTAIDVWW